MKNSPKLLALILLFAPYWVGAVIFRTDISVEKAPKPAFFEKKQHSPFQKRLAFVVAHAQKTVWLLRKKTFFRPKKRRENGIRWSEEPIWGIIGAISGLQSLLFLILAWGAWPTVLVLLSVGFALVAFTVFLSLRPFPKKAERIPTLIGLLLSLPTFLFLAVLLLLVIYIVVLFGVWIIKLIF